MVESAEHRSIISSDCPNGPEEIIQEDGFIFTSNSKVLHQFDLFLNQSELEKKNKKIQIKRIKQFTSFHHFIQLKKIIA